MTNSSLNTSFLNELISEIEDFSSLVAEFASNNDKPNILEDMYIILHTLKGNTSAFRNGIKDNEEFLELIEEFVDYIHKTEDFIEHSKSITRFPKEFTSILFKIDTLLNEYLSCVQLNLSGNSFTKPTIYSIYSEMDSVFKKNSSIGLDNSVPSISELTSDLTHNFKLTLSCDPELKHPYLALLYREIEFEFNTLTLNPTHKDLLEGVEFNDINIAISSNLTPDEIIKKISTFDNVNSIESTDLTNTKSSIDEEDKDSTITEHPSASSNILKIETQRIDKVLKHTSQLVILKNKLNEFLAENNFLSGTPKRKELESIFEDLTSHVEFLQESVLEIRMTPFEQLFNRFPKDVQRIAFEFDKEVSFITIGQRTEIDKNILDELYEPIIHLIRNSIIHGIEDIETRKFLNKNPKGTISIEAHHTKNKVKITISDDGKGIDLDEVKKKALELNLYTAEQLERMSETNILNLIFNQGLSTSNNVNKYSGRGVGMSAFRKKIEDLQGYYEIQSIPNEGTKFNIFLPLTTTIIDAIVTKINDELYSVPLTQIEEIIVIDSKNILYNNNKPYFFWRNLEIPLVLGNKLFTNKESEYYSQALTKDLNVIILHSHNQLLGLSFDKFINQQSIVVKQIHPFLNQSKEIENYHIVSDGSISLIIDTNGLII